MARVVRAPSARPRRSEPNARGVGTGRQRRVRWGARRGDRGRLRRERAGPVRLRAGRDAGRRHRGGPRPGGVPAARRPGAGRSLSRQPASVALPGCREPRPQPGATPAHRRSLAPPVREQGGGAIARGRVRRSRANRRPRARARRAVHRRTDRVPARHRRPLRPRGRRVDRSKRGSHTNDALAGPARPAAAARTRGGGMNEHRRIEELAARSMDGALAAADRVRLDAHLGGCADCRRFAVALRGDDALARSRSRPHAPATVRDAVVVAALRPASRAAVRPVFPVVAAVAVALLLLTGLAVVGRLRTQEAAHPAPRSWVPLGDASPFVGAHVWDVLGTGANVLALGEMTGPDRPRAAGWITTDGLTWARLPAEA